MRFVERHALALVGLIALATAHPICNFFFRCGCGWLGPRHCNIHAAAGPHCPWCTTSWAFPLVIASWLAGAWLGIVLARRRGFSTVIAGIFGFAMAALASGWLTHRVSGYPHFL